MKILLDFLPIVLFFFTFKFTKDNPHLASDWASNHFGFLVSGGQVAPDQAPILLATLVVIVATLAQVGVLLAMRKKVDVMIWVSLGLVVVLGGATIWFHNEAFIKWKPTMLYWTMALCLIFGRGIFGVNLIQKIMGDKMSLPALSWMHLLWAWTGFFITMGGINLFVAYNFSTDTWVNFKLFGGMGLMLIFILAQGVYLQKHIQAADVK